MSEHDHDHDHAHDHDHEGHDQTDDEARERAARRQFALAQVGKPYKYATSGPDTYDCSGLTAAAWGAAGVSLPHYTVAQYSMGSPVGRGDLQPGDLVFFDGLGHVGIYIGGNEFIHSPHTGDVVKISSMTGWYASTYVGARRI